METPDLARIPVFAGVSPEVLAAVGPKLVQKTFLPHDVICRNGDPATEMFIILHGHVEVAIDGTFLVPRGQHDLIGEQALLSGGGRRTATVTAQSQVSALVVPTEAFNALLDDTAFVFNLARALSGKLTQATADRAFHYSREEQVFGEFRAHVAPQVLDRLLELPDRYGAPRQSEVVVLFSDIRDFTRLSAGLDPARIARDLSAYLNHVVDAVHEYDGVVDKFVGDAVMAVWGAFDPPSADHAKRAFKCACRMVQTAGQFSFGPERIRIGVGLNAGPAFVGNVGGERKRQFTVLGATVNLASRYEAKTKELGRPLLLGPDVAKDLSRECQSRLQRHPGIDVKGAGLQNLFSFDPLAEA
jgi:class 3 adenylate cyclase